MATHGEPHLLLSNLGSSALQSDGFLLTVLRKWNFGKLTDNQKSDYPSLLIPPAQAGLVNIFQLVTPVGAGWLGWGGEVGCPAGWVAALSELCLFLALQALERQGQALYTFPVHVIFEMGSQLHQPLESSQVRKRLPHVHVTTLE